MKISILPVLDTKGKMCYNEGDYGPHTDWECDCSHTSNRFKGESCETCEQNHQHEHSM